jgi:ATP synthase protein I
MAKKTTTDLLELSTLGLTLVFSTFIGLGIGLFLDKVFKTKPYLTIVFLLFGVASGFISVFRAIKRSGEK